MPRRRSRRRLWIVLALVVVVTAPIGVYAYRSYYATTDRLGEILDALPLPPGTNQTSEDAEPAASPVTLTRHYELASEHGASSRIVAVLRAADYRSVSLVGGDDYPAGWSEAVDKPNEGAVVVQPGGHRGAGGIQLDWFAGSLTVVVDSGAFP